MKKIVLISLLLWVSFGVRAIEVRGLVVDAETEYPLVGATIYCTTTSTGTATNIEGTFLAKVEIGHEIVISYVGYAEYTQTISEADSVLVVKLRPNVTVLHDVMISSQLAVHRKTPVAATTIDRHTIETKIGNIEFPEVLKSTPGLYVTKPGGMGDSKIMLRGFQSSHVAVMVNGVPMNDMETGAVYWANWAGLADITTFMQTQRGLGAAKVAVPSVGGSINIVTRSTDPKFGGSIGCMVGNDGYNKVSFHVSSGLMDNGWALTFFGSRNSGNGYVQGTEFVAWSWFTNISKVFNSHHTLSFTAFGAPQWHNQRPESLSERGWQQAAVYMKDDSPYKFNPTYGFDKNGVRKPIYRNEYHKPQISLNHNWTIDSVSSLTTVLYASFGRGYGSSGMGSPAYSSGWNGIDASGMPTVTYRNSDGTFAYDKIQELNETCNKRTELALVRKTSNHNWCGLISTYTRDLPKNIDFYAGIDVRFYNSIRNSVVADLCGGDYFVDYYRSSVDPSLNSAAKSADFAEQKLRVGDVVSFDYDGYMLQEGIFTQFEGTFGKFNAFVAGSFSNTAYWRYGRFYYDAQHARSQTANFWSGTVKGGVNYNINQYNNIFANVGFISRAPFFAGGVFLQYQTSNTINQNAQNEKVFSAELGYGFHYQDYFNINLNAYYTLLKDRTLMKHSVGFITNDSGDVLVRETILNVLGLGSRHAGVEIDLKATPTKWLEIKGMFSYGDWRWSSDGIGYFYNTKGEPLADLKGHVASADMAADHASTKYNAKGAMVSGAAQTTAAVGVSVKPIKGLRIGTDVNMFFRNYADTEVLSFSLVEGSEVDMHDSWKIPGAVTWDANVSYNFTIYKNIRATIAGSVNNLLNTCYVSSATEYMISAVEKVRTLCYGFGRTWFCSLKIQF